MLLKSPMKVFSTLYHLTISMLIKNKRKLRRSALSCRPECQRVDWSKHKVRISMRRIGASEGAFLLETRFAHLTQPNLRFATLIALAGLAQLYCKVLKKQYQDAKKGKGQKPKMDSNLRSPTSRLLTHLACRRSASPSARKK